MRQIPSIEQLRQRPAMQALEPQFGRAAVLEALRAEADALRRRVSTGEPQPDDVAEGWRRPPRPTGPSRVFRMFAAAANSYLKNSANLTPARESRRALAQLIEDLRTKRETLSKLVPNYVEAGAAHG